MGRKRRKSAFQAEGWMHAQRHNDIKIQDVGPRAVPGHGVFRVCSGGGRTVGRKGKAGKHGIQDIQLSQKPCIYSPIGL